MVAGRFLIPGSFVVANSSLHPVSAPQCYAQSMGRPCLERLRCAAWLVYGSFSFFIIGCASPGPPRPPSLHLPQALHDLTASREGDHVEVHFTLPQRTTDNLPLRPPAVWATLCRGLESQPCTPIAAYRNRQLPVSTTNSAARNIAWQDTLPASLTSGPPHLLLYRVQLSNSQGRSGGWSAPVYTLAGQPPPPVQDLQAQGTRRGILLEWTPISASSNSSAFDVLIRREGIGAPSAPTNKNKSANEPVWFDAHAETRGSAAAETLDTSAQPDIAYRYVAVRRQLLQIGDHPLEMRSALSAPVEMTLRDIFPPPAPTNLSAAPFTESGRFAVDLVWDPVSAPDLAGYNITRQPIDADGSPTGVPQRLNPSPVALPAFHDPSAGSTRRYRYNVTTVDRSGNESAAAIVVVQPSN